MDDAIFVPSDELAQEFMDIMKENINEFKESLEILEMVSGEKIVLDVNEATYKFIANDITSSIISEAKSRSQSNQNRAMVFQFTTEGRLPEYYIEDVKRRFFNPETNCDRFIILIESELKQSLSQKDFIIKWGKVYLEKGEIYFDIKENSFKLQDIKEIKNDDKWVSLSDVEEYKPTLKK